MKPPYKSDRTEGRVPHPDAVPIKTLCGRCKEPMVCHWPPTMDFNGQQITAADYMAKVYQNDSMGVFCDPCLETMPDVRLEDLFCEEVNP